MSVTDCAVQPAIDTPFDVKPTLPPGAVGVKATPESVAVRVTDALTFDGPVLVTVIVGVSLLTLWVNGPALDVLVILVGNVGSPDRSGWNLQRRSRAGRR